MRTRPRARSHRAATAPEPPTPGGTSIPRFCTAPVIGSTPRTISGLFAWADRASAIKLGLLPSGVVRHDGAMSPVADPRRRPSSAVSAGAVALAVNKPGSPPEVPGSPSGLVVLILGVAATYTSRPSELGAHATEAIGSRLGGSVCRPRSATYLNPSTAPLAAVSTAHNATNEPLPDPALAVLRKATQCPSGAQL